MTSSILITLFLGMQLLNIPDYFMPAWLAIYKEYPLLCQNTPDFVKKAFKKFSQEPHCAVLIATVDNEFAGILTGVPLLSYGFDNAAIISFFQNLHIDPLKIYHFNDAVIFPQYRTKGIGSKLCKKLEKKVKKWGYSTITVSTIEHEDNNEDHPLKPKNFKDPALFWQRAGFTKTSLKVPESWPTIQKDGTIMMQEHRLFFWIKQLT